jgi:serine protease Do
MTMTGVRFTLTPSRGRSAAVGAFVALAILLAPVLPPAASAAPDTLWVEDRASATPPSELLQLSDALAKLAEGLRPAVVQIGPIGDRDPEREPTPDSPPAPGERPRVGSGFIIHPDGYVLTNHHVLTSGNQVEMELFGGEKVVASVAGRDGRTDLALLKIDPPRPLTVLPLGDSDALRVGELVLAIGSPFGLDYSVTMGVVSRIGRAPGATGPYDEFIQTDASINPGNSGGPLLNLRGEVIGINTATVPGRRVGFAIPINLAKSLLPELKEHGKIRWGFLGVSIQNLTSALAQAFALDGTRGALVNQVLPGQPAERAGVRRGDVIVAFDGDPVADARDLQRKVGRTPIGTTAVVRVVRNGTAEELSVQIGELPDSRLAAGEAPKRELGLTVDMLDAEKVKKFKLTEETGVVVTEVAKGGPAARAGLQAGDLIKEVNRRSVSSLEDYTRSLAEPPKPGIDLFLVKRGPATFYIAVRSSG